MPARRHTLRTRRTTHIDNQWYNRAGAIWWDDHEPLSTLRTGLNPARFGYFQMVLQRLGIDPRGKSALDVGCGGGLLAEDGSMTYPPLRHRVIHCAKSLSRHVRATRGRTAYTTADPGSAYVDLLGLGVDNWGAARK